MTLTKRNDSFISALVEETYQSLPESEVGRSPTDLFEYFKRKGQEDAPVSNELISSSGLTCLPLLSIDKGNCYRLILKELVLDFPSNWSIFAEANNYGWGEVDRHGDHGHLLQVLSPYLPTGTTKLAVALSRAGSHMVLMNHDQELRLTNLKNAFVKKAA